jgi:hypothetical protein
MKQWISGGSGGHVAICGLLAILLAASPAGAMQEPSPKPLVMPDPPSLAEIARLEQTRRKALQVPSKVYSDKDVKRASPGPAPAPAAPEPASPGSTPVPDAPAPAAAQPDQTAKGEEFWKNRITQAREEVRRNQVFAEALQSRIGALTTDFVRVEPYQRAGISDERQKAMKELERVNAEIERGKQTVLAIEDEARKAAIPPGWIR